MKSIARSILCILIITSLIADTAGWGLSPIPASQNPQVKRDVILEYYWRTRGIIVAGSKDDQALLRRNNADCLLLSCGKYLVEPHVAGDNVRLLGGIIHEDVEAVMQILASGILSPEDRYKYRAITELVVRFFPPEDGIPYTELAINHLVARMFQWRALMEEKLMTAGDLPLPERSFMA
ncbi:MAG: hypothetical protein PHS37_04265, partial [Candidatus Omnitrophica bacterium]|nr:hypothetical protein [Candidatus Omnitrophota bacterium]